MAALTVVAPLTTFVKQFLFDHYSRIRLPAWVQDNLFYREMIANLIEEVVDSILDQAEGEEAYELRVLGGLLIPLISEQASSDDLYEAALRLGVVVPIPLEIVQLVQSLRPPQLSQLDNFNHRYQQERKIVIKLQEQVLCELQNEGYL